MESRRAESFSDGVFAVAITLLVLNLLPVAVKPITAHALADAWPQYIGYVVSFLTIGIMWLNHHTLLSHATKVDRVALVLNLFLLMGVVAVPFTTALVTNSLAAGMNAASARIAAVVYGLLMIVISICFQALWLYLASHQEEPADGRQPEAQERPERPERPARAPRPALVTTLRFGAGLAGYVIAVVAAAAGSAPASLALYGAIAIYYLFEHLPSAPS